LVDEIQSFVVSRSSLKQQATAKLETALVKLRRGDSSNSLILADQSLELLLPSACLSCGENPHQMLNSRGDKFERWHFTDYLQYLKGKGVVPKEFVPDVFTIHNWRNSAQHSGIKPEREQVRQVFERIRSFVTALP
jgi:hypothetical protein